MKIAILEPIGIDPCTLSHIKDQFQKKGHEIVFYNNRNEDEDELIHRAEGADVVVVSNIPLSKRFIDSCEHLRMISVAFTGVDHIDMEACNRRNIIVSNAAGFSTEAVAELTIGMILSLCRKIVGGDAITRALGGRGAFLGNEINGKTIGIIGAGAIGLRVAEIARAFGCKVIAWSRTPKDIEGVTFVDKETLLKNSDLISLHVPLSDGTRDLIGKEELEMMKSTALLINTARGPVVNREDLAEALSSSQIAGAAVDVYEQEPPLPKDHPYFGVPNMIMLPHMAFATEESFEKRITIVMDNIKLWLEGKPRNVMN